MQDDPKAIFFDLDDTLVDRQAGLRNYSSLLYQAYSDDVRGSAGDLLDTLLRVDDFGSMKQAEALASSAIWRVAPSASQLRQHWAATFGHAAKPFSGMVPVLVEIRERGIKIGIITNGSATLQRAKIAALQLNPFLDCIVISEEVAISKPDPEIFDLGLSFVGCKAQDAWFVGDHPVLDVQAATQAGLRAFWVRTGAHATATCEAGTHLSSLNELCSYLVPNASAKKLGKIK